MNVWISYTLRSGGFDIAIDEDERDCIKNDPDYANEFLDSVLESEGICLEDVECAAIWDDDTGECLHEISC